MRVRRIDPIWHRAGPCVHRDTFWDNRAKTLAFSAGAGLLSAESRISCGAAICAPEWWKMRNFKEKGFSERLQAAAKAKEATLQKFAGRRRRTIPLSLRARRQGWTRRMRARRGPRNARRKRSKRKRASLSLPKKRPPGWLPRPSLQQPWRPSGKPRSKRSRRLLAMRATRRGKPRNNQGTAC